MEDVKAQLALLTRVVTDLQKVVLELKAEISALRGQSSCQSRRTAQSSRNPARNRHVRLEILMSRGRTLKPKHKPQCGSTGNNWSKTPKIVAETDLTSREKVELFAGLFAGRSDVYTTRWASRTDAQKSGYSPKCTMRYTEAAA